MKMRRSGDTARLEGNWTLSEMPYRNIDSLSLALEQIGSAAKKDLRINCENVNEVDIR
jgi:hypothetical protein